MSFLSGRTPEFIVTTESGWQWWSNDQLNNSGESFWEAPLSQKIRPINGMAQQSMLVWFVHYTVQVAMLMCLLWYLRAKNKLFVNFIFFQDIENSLVLNKLWTANHFKWKTVKLFRFFFSYTGFPKTAVNVKGKHSLLTNLRIIFLHNPYSL